MKERLALALALSFGAVFLACAAWAAFDAVDVRERERYGATLRALRRADSELDEALLASRLGLLGHFDPLVSADRAVRESLVALARMPSYVRGHAARQLDEAQGEAARLFVQKRAALEHFKTRQAAVRNSARYLPSLAFELATGDAPAELRTSASALFAALSRFLQASEQALEATARSEAAKLLSVTETLAPSDARRTANQLLQHARLVLAQKPELDALVEEILALPASARIDALDARHAQAFEAALSRAELRRAGLFALFLLALASAAAYVLLRLKGASAQLEDALAQLSSANAELVRERAKERELHALKTRFAARTSHEFKTPLSVIMSSAELLASYGARLSDAKREEHRTRIEGSVREMTTLLDEVLLAFRDDAGERAPERVRTDVVALVRSVVDEVAEALGSRARVELVVPEGPLEGELDTRLTRHIVSNLLSNALKYSPTTEPVRVELDSEQGELVLSVADRGRGIPEADRARLFRDFERGSNVDGVPGTGLGLSVARRAAEAQGGSISVSSRAGQGSLFVVKLPQAGARERRPS